MCTPNCIDFGKRNLTPACVQGKAAIEVGSLNVNGSLRGFVESMRPAEYIGVDIQSGPGVDLVLPAENLVEHFGEERFDLLISTEALEHARCWREVISNMKRVLKPNGLILITTRSKGFGFHSYPYDFWRYEIHDMRELFSDFRIEVLEADPGLPGVFMAGRRPLDFRERDLSTYRLYSIIRKKQIVDISDFYVCLFKVRRPIEMLASRVLPRQLKRMIKSSCRREAA